MVTTVKAGVVWQVVVSEVEEAAEVTVVFLVSVVNLRYGLCADDSLHPKSGLRHISSGAGAANNRMWDHRSWLHDESTFIA